MAESSSSNQAIVETGAAVVATPGELPATLPPVVHDANGVPVVDLREAPGKDGAFVVVDGELVIRLADGTEWPVSTSGTSGEIVLQLADQAFVGASAVAAALESFDTALPVAELAETALREAGAFPASAVETVATPRDEAAASAAEGVAEEEAAEPVSGGAAFRAFELGSIGQSLSPTMELDPTSFGRNEGERAFSTPLDDGSRGSGATTSGSIAVNFAPIANGDSATTSERQAVEIDVLRNDRDPNANDGIKLVDVDTTGLAGRVIVNADGSLNYDPNGQFTHLGKGETATERFTYKIADQQGATDKATVEVTITGVNDTPDAADDLAVTTERTHVAIDALANDTDPDSNDTLRIVSVDSAGLQGTAVLQANGSITYDPNGQFTHLGKGEHATETFSYTVADQHGALSTAEVTVRIEGVNDAPTAHDDLVWVSEEGNARFNALANDTDPDVNDTLRVTNLFSLGDSMGQRWINHDGTVSYRPYGAYDYLGEGEIAYQEFGYTVADQHGATDTGTITVAVVGLNDAPVAQHDFVRVSEDGEVRFDALLNDYDPDLTDSIRAVSIQGMGSEGQKWINHDGTLTYRPFGAFEHLAEGELAYQTFAYTIADQHGATSQAYVTVEIVGVNDAPVAEADHFVGYEDVGFYAPLEALLANDYDVDGAFSFAGFGPSFNGEVSLTPDGYVVFTPTADYTGDAGFYYAIQDEYGAFGYGEVSVDIRGITPGDITFEALALYDAAQEMTVTEHGDGSIGIDILLDAAALSGVGVSLGGMPFFAAILSGELSGYIQAQIAADGSATADGDVNEALSFDVFESPIFQPLGGDLYDALLAAYEGSIGGGQPAPPSVGAPGPSLADLVMGQMEQLGLLDGAGTAWAGAGAEGSATAFGDGTFYLDIAGMLTGGVALFNESDGSPDFLAELFAEFEAQAAIDIRDELNVALNGSVDSSFDVTADPFAGSGGGSPTANLVVEDTAVPA